MRRDLSGHYNVVLWAWQPVMYKRILFNVKSCMTINLQRNNSHVYAVIDVSLVVH